MRVVLKVSFPIFFSAFCVLINVKLQRDIILSFWQHCKNCVAITSQKRAECSIENGAAVACSCAFWGAHGYMFFTAQNKSAVEIHREVCLVYGNCMSIQMIWRWCKHTSLWISTADLFWAPKPSLHYDSLSR